MTTVKRPRSLPVRTVAGPVAAVLAALALAGCGNGLTTSDAGSGAGVTKPATPSPSPTPSPSSSAKQGGGTSSGSTPQPAPPSSSAPAGPPICAAGDLSLRVDQPADGGGTAGSAYLLLNFTNTSSRVCTLSGHPGVSFVGGGDGRQLGRPAAFTGSVSTVRIDPGSSMDALLRVTDPGNYDATECAPTTADGLRVYPPDSRVSLYVPQRLEVCQSELPNGQSQLQVSAVGDAG